jgi:hypothetical protein
MAGGKGCKTQLKLATSVRGIAYKTDSNDNEIEILGVAFEEAMSRLTVVQAREVKQAMKNYRCQET